MVFADPFVASLEPGTACPAAPTTTTTTSTTEAPTTTQPVTSTQPATVLADTAQPAQPVEGNPNYTG